MDGRMDGWMVGWMGGRSRSDVSQVFCHVFSPTDFNIPSPLVLCSLCRFFLKFFLKCNQNCLKNAGNPRDMRRFQVNLFHTPGPTVSFHTLLFVVFLSAVTSENALHGHRTSQKTRKGGRGTGGDWDGEGGGGGGEQRARDPVRSGQDIYWGIPSDTNKDVRFKSAINCAADSFLSSAQRGGRRDHM